MEDLDPAALKEMDLLIHGVFVVGIDLSGPANSQETALVWGSVQGASWQYTGHKLDVDDETILSVVQEQCSRRPTIVGIDAPLSYESGGGMRQRDRELQARLTEAGMHPGSVMAPTMTRMSYLTLRGLAVSRLLAGVDGKHPVSVVEVHPGGAFVLHGAVVHSVRDMKGDPKARSDLRHWLETQRMHRLPFDVSLDDHVLAAAGCALAAWRWSDGQSAWRHAAEPPHHPFDFAC